MARRAPRGRTGGRSPRGGRGGTDGAGVEEAIDAAEEFAEDGLSIGFDKAGFSARITTSGKLKLGIGIAAVDFNLKDPQESSIEYAFGLYEIEGQRNGCTVILRYYIGGILAKTEERPIPECEPDDEDEEGDEDGDEDEDEEGDGDKKPPRPPRLNPYQYYRGVLYNAQIGWTETESYFNGQPGSSVTVKGSTEAWVNEENGTHGIEGTSSITNSEGTEPYGMLINGRYDNLSFRSFYGFGGWRYSHWVRPTEDTPGYWGVVWHLVQRMAIGSASGWVIDDFVDSQWRNFNGSYDYPIYNGSGSVIGRRSYTERKEWKLAGVLLWGDRPPPLHNPPPKKPMEKDEKCCKKVEQIWEVLDCERFLAEGAELPRRLWVPWGSGEEKIENYLDLMLTMVSIQDHLGIHPFKVTLLDANKGKAGNQELRERYSNATGAAQKIIELLLENKGDAADRLNLLFRIAWINSQIISGVTKAVRLCQGIFAFLGIPSKEEVDLIDTPFDVTLGQGKKIPKGFGKGKKPSAAEMAKILEIHDEDSLESILPRFLERAEQQCLVEKYDSQKGMDFWDRVRMFFNR